MIWFRKFALGALLAATPVLLVAQVSNVLPPLPTPLVLPPGNEEVLPIAKSSSYLGDAIRIVDCPDTKDEPFGTCGNLLFGGLALYNTHLTGKVKIHFEQPVNNIAHFEVTHPNDLVGDDVFMAAPQVYQFGVGQNRILDDFDEYSQGDLNLINGEVTNLTYLVFVSNSFYVYLENANPQLKPPPFTFPGGYGTSYAKFSQRPDGLLDFTFYGSTFLPLGSNVNGDPVRVPLPFCGPYLNCANVQALGTSLHPHLALSTIPVNDAKCGDACPAIPASTIKEFTLNAAVSDIGDDFSGLNIPQLGGGAVGRSQLQGRVQIQFGQQNGNYVPVAFNALPPSGLLVPPPAFPISGLSLGWVGHDEFIHFPKLTYDVTATATTDDPFDLAIGELDVTTGKLVGGLLWRQFWTQSLLVAILNDNVGHIGVQSFFLRGPADFTKGDNNELLFRYQGTTLLNFTGAFFPAPDYTNTAGLLTSGAGSVLEPFNNIQAALVGDAPSQVMTASQTNLVSSHADSFSYSYSIPCAGQNQPATFTYTNNNASTGGTFTMQNLVSVSCTNSRQSAAPSGTYDSIAFTGFGKWSKDDNPHVVTVQAVTSPVSPFFITIQVDGGSVSNVNLKPATIPVP
jgi:hypothetical protein